MARVDQFFLSGKMDSDTHYALLDNKTYVRNENLRISSDGDDGALKHIKGSDLVSNHSENSQMTVIGMYEGINNKCYYFLAMPNGKSRIVEYDVETKQSRIIIEDNKILRFDLIRWDKGVTIQPLRYLLNINQIGNLLFFSHEVWKYPRVVNLDRIQNYANGFTELDISLPKMPPKTEPKILCYDKLGIDVSMNGTILPYTKGKNIDKSNIFVSFAYRYKYLDGDYSTLSSFSDTAFEHLNEDFYIDNQRLNKSMVNKNNNVYLLINSGGKNVTDIEVIAKDHNTNIFYIIYSANKKKQNIQNNSDVEIKYSFSNAYPLLSNEIANISYSNTPLFPKTQTIVGNRLFYGNYKEGYDLGNNEIDFDIKLVTEKSKYFTNNTSICSMYSYKFGIIYLDDYNITTTVLSNLEQNRNEIFIPFVNRIYRNFVKIKPNSLPPAFATKMKFVALRQELNFETVYITYAKKIGEKVYIKLEKENIEKIKKGDTIIRVDLGVGSQKEYNVLDVKEYTVDDGLTNKGIYACFETNETNFRIEDYGLNNISIKHDFRDHRLLFSSADNNRFISISTNNTGSHSQFWNIGIIKKVDIGEINEGDELKLNILLKYLYWDEDDEENIHLGDIEFSETLFASKSFSSIFEFIKSEFKSPYFNIEENKDEILFRTNNLYPEYVKEKSKIVYEAYTHLKLDGFFDNYYNILYVQPITSYSVIRGIKPQIYRTKIKELQTETYYETHKTYPIINGKAVGADSNGYFDTGFYNCYCWGNGIESYKIKDAFNAKKLNYNFRPNAINPNGYKQVHRKNDITYSGIYNHELGINNLSIFNAGVANWKTMPIHYGEIQRIVSTDGDLSVFMTNKVISVMYGKSVLMDMRGNENIGLSKDVLGDAIPLPYEFGISNNPESIAKHSNLIFFVDKNRSRFLVKMGNEIQELNIFQSGFHKEGVDLLKYHQSFFGSYDDAHDEFVIGFDGKYSLRYNLSQKGFSAYRTVNYDYLFSMNGKFFTAYKGIIYEDEANEFHNNISGQGIQKAKVLYVVNPEVNSDKVFRAMYLHSDTTWHTKIRTNLTESEIPESAYDKKESYFYTDIFRDTKGNYTSQGIGNIEAIIGDEILFKFPIPTQINIGDNLVSVTNRQTATITGKGENFLQVSSTNGFVVNDFVFATKQMAGNYRPDGASIRGKWMEVELTKISDKPYHITSVSTEITQSRL